MTATAHNISLYKSPGHDTKVLDTVSLALCNHMHLQIAPYFLIMTNLFLIPDG